ncbi:Pleiotropic drug resistance protein 4 [Hordeum vulgare]|nr:Pleiotropic drug resistance protein 4 [Hordeum vulgare]
MWSRGRDDLFSRSRSSWDEDDKEALRLAALEKLPTYDRTRMAVLAMPEGEIKEVNADKLGAQQRIGSIGVDHEWFLSKFKDLVHRAWIELPTIEVHLDGSFLRAYVSQYPTIFRFLLCPGLKGVHQLLTCK